MIRTKTKTRSKPKPGGAKLNVAVDQELEKHAGEISRALIREAQKGNPTCLHLLIRWAEDAEFAEQCLTAHGDLVERWLVELEEESQKANEAEQAAHARDAKAPSNIGTASANHANATTPSIA